MLNRIMPILIALTAQPVFSDLSSYLPLNVGNSWEYRSGYYENLAHEMPGGRGAVGGHTTLSIDRTEEIDGKTYYVFSPWWKDWPLPSHALFGKKVRWEGDSLMVHDGTSEYPLFRFDEGPATPEASPLIVTYSVDPAKFGGDTEVEAHYWQNSSGSYRVSVRFTGANLRGIVYPYYNRWVGFLRGFGMVSAGEDVTYEGNDYDSYHNSLVAVKARLLLTSGTDARDGDNGNTEDTYVEMTRSDVRRGRAGLPFTITNVPPSSWGNVKEERLYR